jgi:hypothetical protein
MDGPQRVERGGAARLAYRCQPLPAPPCGQPSCWNLGRRRALAIEFEVPNARFASRSYRHCAG